MEASNGLRRRSLQCEPLQQQGDCSNIQQCDTSCMTNGRHRCQDLDLRSSPRRPQPRTQKLGARYACLSSAEAVQIRQQMQPMRTLKAPATAAGQLQQCPGQQLYSCSGWQSSSLSWGGRQRQHLQLGDCSNAKNLTSLQPSSGSRWHMDFPCPGLGFQSAVALATKSQV